MELTLTPRGEELLRDRPLLGTPEQVVEVALERLFRDLHDPKQALAILDEIDDLERLRKMKLAEGRDFERSQRDDT